MFRLAPFAATIALLAALAVACADGEDTEVTPAKTAAGTPTVLPTTSATPTPSPNPPPTAEKVVFIPGPEFTGKYPIRGPLWIANIDGSDAIRISPDGLIATFGDVVAREDGVPLVYFVSHAETHDQILAYDPASGEASVVFEGDDITSVSASPASPLLALTQGRNLDLLDLTSHKVRRILEGGDPEACAEYAISECRRFHGSQWSPDGRLLVASEGLWEGSVQHVVDPFGSETKIAQGGRSGFGGWSPSSDAICTRGVYGGTSGLAIDSAPDWQTRLLLAEYEDWRSNPEGTSVQSCDWVGATELVVLTSDINDPNQSAIATLDLTSQQPSAVASFDDSDYCCTRQIILMPDAQRVITQAFDHQPSGTGNATQPEIIDLASGEIQSILQPGDWVVGVLP